MTLVIVFQHQIKKNQKDQKIKGQAWITSTPRMIRACLFILLSGPKVTSTTNMDHIIRTIDQMSHRRRHVRGLNLIPAWRCQRPLKRRFFQPPENQSKPIKSIKGGVKPIKPIKTNHNQPQPIRSKKKGWDHTPHCICTSGLEDTQRVQPTWIPRSIRTTQFPPADPALLWVGARFVHRFRPDRRCGWTLVDSSLVSSWWCWSWGRHCWTVNCKTPHCIVRRSWRAQPQRYVCGTRHPLFCLPLWAFSYPSPNNNHNCTISHCFDWSQNDWPTTSRGWPPFHWWSVPVGRQWNLKTCIASGSSSCPGYTPWPATLGPEWFEPPCRPRIVATQNHPPPSPSRPYGPTISQWCRTWINQQ